MHDVKTKWMKFSDLRKAVEDAGLRLRSRKALTPLTREQLLTTRRVGLGRGAGTEVRYSPAVVEELQLVEQLKAQGIPLSEMKPHMAQHAAENVARMATKNPARSEIITSVLGVALRKASGEELAELGWKHLAELRVDDRKQEHAIWDATREMAEVAIARWAVGHVLTGALSATVDAELDSMLVHAFEKVRRVSAPQRKRVASKPVDSESTIRGKRRAAR
jgi:hypothetical protein